MESIVHAFSSGGIWMVAILAAHVVTIAIMIDRGVALFVVRTKGQKKLVQEFENEIKKGQLDKVIAKAKHMESQPLSAVVQAGAQAAMDMGGKDEIQAKMDEVLAHENEALEKRTGFLSMLANVATLLGLLGTITGMIKSFAAIGNASAMEKASLLSAGIAEAMHATAYGLIVAIPALVAFAILQNRANQLAEDLNQASLKAFHWLSYSYESVPSKKPRLNM